MGVAAGVVSNALKNGLGRISVSTAQSHLIADDRHFGILKSFDLKKEMKYWFRLLPVWQCLIVCCGREQSQYMLISTDRSTLTSWMLKKVTSKTRAILIQHTLGILADMDNVLAFAKKIISWLSKIALIVWARHAEGKK